MDVTMTHKNDVKTKKNALKALREAFRRIAQYESEAQLRKRMKGTLLVLVLSFVVMVAAFVTLVLEVPQSESAQLLAAFVFLGSMALVMLATMGFALVCWSGYMREQVSNLLRSDQARRLMQQLRSLETHDRIQRHVKEGHYDAESAVSEALEEAAAIAEEELFGEHEEEEPPIAAAM